MPSRSRMMADLVRQVSADGLPAENVPIDAIDGIDADNTQEALEALAEGAGGGEANTASNLGSGAEVYASKSGVDLRFRSLTAGQGTNIAQGSSAITIRSAYVQSGDPGSVGAGLIWVQP